MPEKITEKDQSEVITRQSGSAFLTTLISEGECVKNKKPF